MVRRVLSQTTAQHVSRPVLFAPSRMIDAEETTNTTTERFSSTVTELWDSTKMQESNYPNHRGTSLVSFGSAFDETKRETAMPASVGARGETKQDKGAFQQCILEATQIASFGENQSSTYLCSLSKHERCLVSKCLIHGPRPWHTSDGHGLLHEPPQPSEVDPIPHGMQQLYRCWAWFEEQRHNAIQPVKPVVYLPKKYPSAKRSPFWRGIIQSMPDVANVTFVEPPDHKNDTTNASSSYVGLAPSKGDKSAFYIAGGGAYAFVKPVNAHSLRSVLVKQQRPYRAAADKAAQTCDAIIQSSLTQQPRMAILNREGSRKVLNTGSLAVALKHSLNADVPVVFFEQFDFEQQASFFTLSIFSFLLMAHNSQASPSFLIALWCWKYSPRATPPTTLPPSQLLLV